MRFFNLAAFSGVLRRLRAVVDHPRQAVVLILAVAITARLAVAVSTAPILTPDSYVYYYWARAISWHFNFWPIVTYRTPLYPGFIAVFLHYFGESPATGIAIICAQYLMGVFSTLFLYRIVLKLFSKKSAFVTAVLFATSPLVLYSETLVQTEALFIFLFFCALTLMVEILQGRGWLLAPVLGVACGLLTLTRPVAQLLPAVFLAALILKRLPVRQYLLMFVLIIGTYGGTIYPWMQINRYAFDRWTLAQLSGVNLFHRVFDIDKIQPSQDPAFAQIRAFLGENREQDRYFTVLDRLGKKVGSPIAADEAMFAFAFDSLKREPGKFVLSTFGRYLDLFLNFDRTIQFCGNGTDRFLCSRSTSGRGTGAFPNTGREFGYKFRALIYSYFSIYDALIRYEFFVFLAILGAIVALRRSHPQRYSGAFLLAVVVYFTFVTGTLSDADDRFRLPIDGLIYAFCALGIEALWLNRKWYSRATDIHCSQSLTIPYESLIVRRLDGNILFWDAYAEAGYGWGRQEVLGDSTHEIFSTQFPAPLPEINAQLLQRKYWEGSLTHNRKDGSRITVHSRWELVYEAPGAEPIVIEVNQIPRDLQAS